MKIRFSCSRRKIYAEKSEAPPDEIARGFESRADLETLREKARKYRKTRMICWIALALTAAAIAAAIIVVKSNENYHSEIKSDSHIEEVES